MLLLSVIPWPGPSVFKISCPRDRASVVRRIVQKVKKFLSNQFVFKRNMHVKIHAYKFWRGGMIQLEMIQYRSSFLPLIFSEMDANSEETSSGIAAGVPVPRKSGHFSTPAKGETSAQTIAMDLRPVRQILLRGETLGCPLR